MICNDEQYKMKVMNNLINVFNQDLLPISHINFLENVLYKKFNIQPQIIYDIGSCCLRWERHARRIWKDAKIYVFDAYSPLEEIYKQQKVNYNMCCLSNVNNLEVKYYQNDFLFGGNSIYKEKMNKYFHQKIILLKKLLH
jgi:hypothetical protein